MSNENNVNATTPEQKADDKKQEKCTLKISEYLEFEGQAKCLYMDTKDLCHTIGSILSPILPDYAGCKIRINDGSEKNPVLNLLAPGELYVNLFFKQSEYDPDPETHNVILAHKVVEGTSMFNRMANVMGSNSKRIYALSDWTKEVLLDFTHPYEPNPEKTYKKYLGWARWNERIVEASQPVTSMPNSSNEVTVGVIGLPLLTFIYTIYGATHKLNNGEKFNCDYAVFPMRKAFMPRVPNLPNPSADEYIIQITQLSDKIKSDMSRAVGYGYQDPVDYNIYNR